MKRMKFNRPTNHYDERIKQIDEKICELIRERKEISGDNPGYPPFEYISNWAEKFDLYEDLLKAIFGSMYNDKGYKPMVEPEGFQRNLPILKSIEVDNRFFSIIYIRQYSNCSVVNLNVDWDNSGDSVEYQFRHTHYISKAVMYYSSQTKERKLCERRLNVKLRWFLDLRLQLF